MLTINNILELAQMQSQGRFEIECFYWSIVNLHLRQIMKNQS